jgi:hypothetical protein
MIRDDTFKQIVTALALMHRENIVGTSGMVDLQGVLSIIGSHTFGWKAVVKPNGSVAIERD